MPKTAISFNIPPKLWLAFKKQTDELFLSRAAFLDYMIQRELRELRSEFRGLKLSARAKRHIAGAMKKQAPVSVSIGVRRETAEALRQAMREHNLVRDAFMSRLILLLRSTDSFLDLILIPRVATSQGISMGLEETPASPMKAMEAIRDDPLFYIRAHVEHAYKVGVYRMPLPRRLDWAACYLRDDDLAKAATPRRQKKKSDGKAAASGNGRPTKSTRQTRR